MFGQEKNPKESKKKRNNNNNKNEEKNVEIYVDIYPTKNIDSGVDSDDDDDGKRASDKIKMMNKKKRWQKNDNDKNKNQFINRVTNQNSMLKKIYKEFIPFESNSSKHKQTNKTPSILVIVLSSFFFCECEIDICCC